NLQLGAKTTLVVPSLYIIGFVAQAFVLETSQPVPSFRAGLSIEAIEEKYICSFDVFLGDFKVWSTSHLSRFYTYEKCVIDFTGDGDLRLTGHDDEMGWRTATFGQGVKSLRLSNTGNLVLLDEFNMIKWQSFHFPTNVWSTSHLSRFYTYEKCVIDFTWDGDLRLTGHDDEMGWRTATFGQGIKEMKLAQFQRLVFVPKALHLWENESFAI
nr:G-type lectin S-receptor-like serine/threonine-protein kinase SD2-5 [Tanacetum cinerariifolium]